MERFASRPTRFPYEAAIIAAAFISGCNAPSFETAFSKQDATQPSPAAEESQVALPGSPSAPAEQLAAPTEFAAEQVRQAVTEVLAAEPAYQIEADDVAALAELEGLDPAVVAAVRSVATP